MGTDRENIVPRDLCIIWKLNETWPLKKGLGHILTTLKAFKTQKELHYCLMTLQVFNTEKGLRHFLTAFKVINVERRLHHLRLLKLLILKKNTITALKFLIPKKDSIAFLWLLKFLMLKKGCMPFLRFNFEKWLHHILMTLKVVQKSYSVKCWWPYLNDRNRSSRLEMFCEKGILKNFP